MAERSGRVKQVDKDILIGKQMLCVQAEQNKELIHYFPSVGRYLAATKKARLHHVWLLPEEDLIHPVQLGNKMGGTCQGHKHIA